MKLKSPKYKYNNVLLIDDNDLDNFINEKMLESNLFAKNVYVTTDGKSALDAVNKLISSEEKVREIYPDIMFVDLNMPVMNGFEFIENFKKINDDKLRKCKIVILTSSISNDDRTTATNLDPGIIFRNKPLTNDFLKDL